MLSCPGAFSSQNIAISKSEYKNTHFESISSSADSSFPILVPMTNEQTSHFETDSLELGETTLEAAYILFILYSD